MLRRLVAVLTTTLVALSLLGAAPAQAHSGHSKSRGSGTVIDVNMSTHKLTMYRNGRVIHRSHISGGGGYRYCTKSGCRRAVTPRGTFYVNRKIRGVRHAELGTLYSPMYFKGGFALHGSRSVPRHHASHGCIRLQMRHLDFIYRNTPVGTKVVIHN